MFLAYFSQMVGLDDIDPSVSAFLTSLYVVFTAIITTFMAKKRPTRILLCGVLLATFGAGFIEGPPHLSWGLGEILTVICAALFALHIIFTQKITQIRDPIGVSTTSFIVVTICSIFMVYLLGFIEGDIDEPALAKREVAEDALVIVVSPKHPWANGRALSPQALVTQTNWILREAGSGTRSEFETALRDQGVIK